MPYGRMVLFEVASDAPCWERTDLFFSPDTADQEHAKSICVGCPRRMECLLGAAERHERDGIWGGVCFPDEYRALRRLAARAAALGEDPGGSGDGLDLPEVRSS